MKLNEKYMFSDFTIFNYKVLLKLAQQNYIFKLFTDCDERSNKTILLRHDIEFSIPISLQMAKIEADMGIKATYFLQVHSDFYNPFEKLNFDSINRIIKLGHQLGLHFDAHFWNIKSEDNLEKHIDIDLYCLKQYFDTEIKAFSFHNTNSFTQMCEKDYYSGLVNVYSNFYKMKVGYCSDSTGYWRYERLEDRLKEAKDQILQVLVHDGMWSDETLPPRRRIFKIIDSNSTFLKEQYDYILKKFGAKNIDWNDVL